MERWIKLVRAKNGYIVEYPEYYLEHEPGDPPFYIAKEVFEDKRTEQGDVDSMVEALQFIDSDLGPITGDYNKKYVYIRVKRRRFK